MPVNKPFTNSLIGRYIKSDNFVGVIAVIFVFSLTFAIYVHNLSPSVYGGDSGDFLSAISTKGVAHPSGYPLFTLLGLFFENLPIGMTPAWRVGLISCIFSSLGVVIAYLITKKITKNKVLSIAASLNIAFFYPYWLYAETVEVFSLHYFFVFLLIYITLSYVETKNKNLLIMMSFFTSLSLSNNLSTILILPAALVAILLSGPAVFKNLTLIIKAAIAFALGLLPYIYIPIAARNNPPINWGYATNLENLINLFLRKNYSWGSLSNFDTTVLRSNIVAYTRYLVINSNFIIFSGMFLGIVYLFTKRKLITLMFLLIAFILLGPFYILYSRYDVTHLAVFGIQERFYVPSMTMLLLLFPLGIDHLNTSLSKKLNFAFFRKIATFSVHAIAIIAPIIYFASNFHNTNFKNVYIGDNFARDILSSTPTNSIIWFSEDTAGFNSLYLKYSLGYRNDVLILGHWGGDIAKLISEYNLLNADVDLDEYLVSTANWLEPDLKYASLAPSIENRNVFSDIPLSIFDNEGGEIISVPYGLLHKLEFKNDFKTPKEDFLRQSNKILESLQLPEILDNQDIVENSMHYYGIRRMYALAYSNISKFLYEYYDDEDAYKTYLDTAYQIDPLLKLRSQVPEKQR